MEEPGLRRRRLAPLLAAGAALLSTPLLPFPTAIFTASLAAQGPGTALTVRTDFASVSVDKVTGGLTVRVLDGAGGVVHAAEAPRLLLDGVVQRGFTTMGPAWLRNSALELRLEVLGPRAVAVSWTARDGERHDFGLELRSDDRTSYYGTGERFNALDQRGYSLPVITDDRYGNKGTGSYKPVPFFMSSRGFGVWVDSYAPGVLDLSATERFVSTLRFPETRLRVVFFAGPDFGDILEAYTGLTGRPPVPPPWSFGLWKSRDIYHHADSVYADIERLRGYDIPASVLVLDSPWETGYNNFRINRLQFPDPDSMFARVREAGFEVALWLTPFVNDSNVQEVPGIDLVSSNFDDAARAGHLVERGSGAVARVRWWKGRGGLIDFTDPAAIEYWHSLLRRTRQWDVRAFKVDDGEGNFVPDAVFASGASPLELKNRYSVLYDSVMQAYIDEELDGEGVLLVRSGHTGVQRYPFAWAGDNHGSFAFDDGLPSVILAGQNAAMSGISLWGHDIAGYAGRASKELFIRWAQFGAFSPLMQVHMTSNQGPWDFDDETLEIFRRFTRIRTRLFPYLYEAAHESARTGMPIIRPMALAFQDDPDAHGWIYQYMFGPDLLVAPMYRPGTHRSVYLPAGAWIDWWTGERVDGPRTIEVHAPLDRMPLFVRAGAILPMIPDDVETLVARHPAMSPEIVALDDRRVLEVWPGERGSVTTTGGLGAWLIAAGGTGLLRVESEVARPLEVRLIGRRLPDLEVPGATVSVEERGTAIRFERFEGEALIEWREDGG